MLHPRGRDGKFIKKFGRVIINDPFGGKYAATVQEISADGRGGIVVQKDDGTRAKIKKNWVERSVKSKARLGMRKPDDDADLPDDVNDLLNEIMGQYPDKPGGNDPKQRALAKVNKSLKLALESDDPIYRMGKIEDAMLALERTGDKEERDRLARALDREEDRYNADLADDDDDNEDPEKTTGEKARLDAPEPEPEPVTETPKKRPGRPPLPRFAKNEDVPFTYKTDEDARNAKTGDYVWYSDPSGNSDGWPVRVVKNNGDGTLQIAKVVGPNDGKRGSQAVTRKAQYIVAGPDSEKVTSSVVRKATPEQEELAKGAKVGDRLYWEGTTGDVYEVEVVKPYAGNEKLLLRQRTSKGQPVNLERRIGGLMKDPPPDATVLGLDLQPKVRPTNSVAKRTWPRKSSRGGDNDYFSEREEEEQERLRREREMPGSKSKPEFEGKPVPYDPKSYMIPRPEGMEGIPFYERQGPRPDFRPGHPPYINEKWPGNDKPNGPEEDIDHPLYGPMPKAGGKTFVYDSEAKEQLKDSSVKLIKNEDGKSLAVLEMDGRLWNMTSINTSINSGISDEERLRLGKDMLSKMLKGARMKEFRATRWRAESGWNDIGMDWPTAPGTQHFYEVSPVV